MKVTIKQHDTKGVFEDTLKLNGQPVDLSGAVVSFLMKKSGVLRLRQNATVMQTAPPPDPSAGTVRYQPVPTDVAIPGLFRQEWEALLPSSLILTFPNNDYNEVEILQDLG